MPSTYLRERYLLIKKGKKSNLTVEKSGRCHLNQVIKVDANCNGANCHHSPPMHLGGR
jgi:hypothetical protein